MHYDVIVIGAGLAGLVAANRHAHAGRRTLLLAKGQGTLHWSSGCIDLWPGVQPQAAISQLAPPHPYALCGPDPLQAAISWLQSATRAAGYPLAGAPTSNLYLPTALGTWRPTALAPHSMIAAERNVLADGPVLVAGFRELRDFYPPMLAARLNQQGIAAQGHYLTMPPTKRTLDFNTVQLARLFEQPDFRADIGRQLRALRGDARAILLPAVLGIKGTLAIVAELQASSGALIAEVPTMPTNVPGLRLYELLVAAFEAAGGRIQLTAEVVGGAWDGPTLQAVSSTAAAREQQHHAEQFVLATGGIGGGGLRADYPGQLRETALNLPVAQPDARSEWFDPAALKAQAVYCAGIAVDQQLRPIDRHGAVLARNVRVAGAALAGADLLRQRCVEGVALASGWLAGA
jgi:glycerol-3-phosphate dehydrogenase subunit B